MLSSSTSSVGSFLLTKGLFKLSMIAFTIGLIFFVVWAIKNLKKDKLLKLSVVLMVVGVLACLLTMAFGGSYHKYKKGYGYKTAKGMMSWETCQKKVKSLDAKSATTTTTKDAKKTTAK